MLRGRGIYLAFANSKNITTLNLPEIMDEIHAYAFRNTNIYTVNIPETLQRLSSTAFQGSLIYTAYMDEQHSVYYDGCLLYHEPDYVVGTYHVKEGTRLIASGVFSGDNKIYELVLPKARLAAQSASSSATDIFTSSVAPASTPSKVKR